MNPTEIGIRLVAGVLLILANGFFVAIEFALTRARQFTESEFVDGDSRLERAWEMTQELELYLTTCQVGITASSIAVGIVAEPALAALFEPLFAGTTLATIGAGALIAYLIINLLHLTHG
ncbi:inosine monophosphate dehydrogenase, partial [Haloferax sp. BAB-2207]